MKAETIELSLGSGFELLTSRVSVSESAEFYKRFVDVRDGFVEEYNNVLDAYGIGIIIYRRVG